MVGGAGPQTGSHTYSINGGGGLIGFHDENRVY